MASSGTIIGPRSGTQPRMEIDWDILQQDIPGNRSQVRIRLYVNVLTGGVHWSAEKSGSVSASGNGTQSFTNRQSIGNVGRYLVHTRTVWINHRADGTQTATFSGVYNIQVTWSGTWVSSLSVSGTANLDTIPRASELNSFMVFNSLVPNSSNTARITIQRAASSFSHDIQLRDGSTVLQSWNGISNSNMDSGTSFDLTISASTVNTLLSRMRNDETRLLTLRVQTKSGSTNIGSALTRTGTAVVNNSVTPNASGLSVAINGTGRDSTINRYVQNITRVSASFNASATGGAAVASTRIVVRRDSDKSNSMTINGSSGVSGVVTGTGTYEVIATVTDTRGRTGTQRTTFAVQAYREPQITRFIVTRSSSVPTTVSVDRAGNHSPLGTLNPLRLLIQKREGHSENWSTVEDVQNVTQSSFSSTITNTGNSVTSSYEFRITITDSFNNRAERTGMVSTQRVVLDIHKNDGVGIGKIRERGVLDVDGEAYFSGRLMATSMGSGSAIGIMSPDANGHGYIGWAGPSDTRLAYIGVPNSSTDAFEMRNEMGGPIRLTGSAVSFNSTQIVNSGSNSNGDWVRLYDGTQICWSPRFSIRATNDQQGSLFRTATQQWTFPAVFSEQPAVIVTLRRASGGFIWGAHNGGIDNTQVTNMVLIGINSTTEGEPRGVAIGRWS